MYPHSGGDPIGCAITGAFLTASGYPGQYSNAYFYADFCSQWIYYLPAPTYNTATPFVTGLGKSAVDLHVRDGELYYLTRDAGGTVFKITYSTPRPGLRFVPVTPCPFGRYPRISGRLRKTGVGGRSGPRFQNPGPSRLRHPAGRGRLRLKRNCRSERAPGLRNDLARGCGAAVRLHAELCR